MASFLLLAAALLAIFAGCATDTRIEEPRTPMTVREARKSLTESLGLLKYITSVREVRFNQHRVIFTCADEGNPRNGIIYFEKVGDLLLRKWSDDHYNYVSNGKMLDFGGVRTHFRKELDAMKCASALLALKAAALAPDTEEADFTAFTASANSWLAAMPKPEMTDDARAHKALAEDAFKRKDFLAALWAYGDALDKHPMWPEGHYNAALLAAETEDFELAVRHMRRYLVLAPNAKDTASAKDKFLLWQLKAKQEAGPVAAPSAK